MSNSVNRLAMLRKRLEKNQDEVAQAVGISRTALSNFENGRTALSRMDIAIALAQYYGVSLDYIAGLSPVPHPEKGDSLSAALNRLSGRSDNAAPSVEEIAMLVHAATAYLSSGKPCGDAPLIAWKNFTRELAICFSDAVGDDAPQLLDHANAAAVAALEITKMPALLLAKIKGDGQNDA